MKVHELNWIVNMTHNEPFCPMSTSPKHLFIARFNSFNDCVNRMGLLMEGNRGMYAERVLRVQGGCVGRPTDMRFPAVANTAFGNPKMDKIKKELFWYLQEC